MNIETAPLANETKDNLFDSQAESPHSAETKATTAAMTKTMRETGTMRDPAIESPRILASSPR